MHQDSSDHGDCVARDSFIFVLFLPLPPFPPATVVVNGFSDGSDDGAANAHGEQDQHAVDVLHCPRFVGGVLVVM